LEYVMEFKRKALAVAVMVASSTLTACGSSSSDPKPPVTPTNSAPTAVTLSANTVDENAVAAEVGTLTATDADAGDTFTYTVDNDLFVISGDKLMLAAESSVDFEAIKTFDLEVTVTDKAGATFTQALTVNVNDLLDYYDFASIVGDTDKSSVSYSGQTARHALIAELKHYIGNGGLQADLDSGDITTKEQVLAKLNSLYDADENSWDGLAITFTDSKQKFFSEISSSYKSLKEKVAGNDASGQHQLWNGDENGENIAFAGWGVKGSITPTQLIETYFAELADIAIDNLGNKRFDPITNSEIPVYVTEAGTDLNQLIQKFLLMSIAYSQSADDYLDENKGLATDNIGQDKGTKDYTKLEHQFDEGFGYFGAAKNYLSYNDNELSGKVKVDGEGGRLAWNSKYDTNADGVIDLLSEFNFGNSVNAAKRDRGTVDHVNSTDLTKVAMDAFLGGRKLINDNAGMALTESQMEELLAFRDNAINAWELSIVGTVVHYINDLSEDLHVLDTEEFDFATTAKHFSELKGFALGLQFNPYSKLSDEKFAEFHNLIGDAPVIISSEGVTNVDVEVYKSALMEARDILQTELGLDAENVENW
jgi:hypothetical protein